MIDRGGSQVILQSWRARATALNNFFFFGGAMSICDEHADELWRVKLLNMERLSELRKTI